jgi:glycosyltransferase involved in cell wall biosynthesis
MNFQDKLRILYVSMADVSQPNGPGVNEREFLLSLYARLGTRMHALIPKPARPCTELDPSRTTFYRNPRRWDLVGFLLQQRELYRQIRYLSSASPFDLMVVRLSLLPLGCAWLGERTLPLAIKTLGEVQGFTQNRGLKGAIAKLLGPPNAALFQRIVKRAIAVDCCTERHYYDHLHDYALDPEKLLVVQNATNVTRFYPGPVRDARTTLGFNHFDPVIGFVGGSPAERGGMQMLELAVRLRDSFPRLGIVIVGKDTNGSLQRRARELHVEDRALITGEVAYEEVPTYIRAFDLGMALDRPSRWQLTGNSYQKVRQYLACGKPVVTCIEPESELVRQGFVQPVPADDLAAIEHAVRSLLARTSSTQEAFTERAARFAREHLSTELTLDQRLQFWGQRLDESRRNPSSHRRSRAA